jgi:uncharacterized membrane protein YjfL (UPF0719 family)
MENQYEFAWQSGVFLITCLALLFFARGMFKLFNYKLNIQSELTDKDNIAFYLGYVAYFVAVVLIVGGVMSSEGNGVFWVEICYTLFYGIIGIVVLNIAFIILDKLVHPSIKMMDEITLRQNVAIGILKGSNYIGTGIIIGGVLLTEVNKPIEALIFLALAVFLSLIGFLYYKLITRFNIREEIYDGNMAVACSTAGAQIGFAILISAGFQIEHAGWLDSLITIGIDVVAGFVILPLVRIVADKAFISARRITDEVINQEIPNLGIGIFEGSAYICGSLLFVWCWNL